MAKTDWQMGDTVQPADMNQIGQEINQNAADVAAAAATAQNAQQTADSTAAAAANAQDAAEAAGVAATAAQNTIDGHIGQGGSAHATATTGAAGFMSAADKSKLDEIEAGAQVNDVTSVAGKTGAVTLVKGDVGLGSVQNFGIASQAQAEAGSANNVYMTPLRTKQYIDTRLSDNIIWRIGNAGPEYSTDGGGTFKTMANMQAFKSNGTFVVPAGVEGIFVTACGGGGGGAGGTRDGGNDDPFGGAGGGGAACIIHQFFAVTPGQILSITVGQGGQGGAGGMNGSSGAAGEATVISPLISLPGGGGALVGFSSSIRGSSGGLGGGEGGSGGVGGSSNASAGSIGLAGKGGNAHSANDGGGGGGGSYGGGGGGGRSSGNSPGGEPITIGLYSTGGYGLSSSGFFGGDGGFGAGGGGGGANGPQAGDGGNGGPGVVIIEW